MFITVTDRHFLQKNTVFQSFARAQACATRTLRKANTDV